jgi:lipopolysaccharide/colanic/teichoic acid biosynthesis glycosyltransferase
MKECTEGHSGQLGLIAIAGKTRSGCPGWKRCLDIGIVLLGLPFVLPVMLLAALIIRLVSRGPIFFKQQRIGYQGKPFTVLKFRTMHANADPKAHQEYVNRLIAQNLPLTKMDVKGDKRLIPMGRVLRASCVDELPQLFNVLLGDMSLVGPRPCMEFEYNQLLPWHKQRFNTPPGMTGLWQVKRGAHTSFREMMQLDLEYVANRTLWLDVSILLETVPAVFSQLKESRMAKRLQRQQLQETAI